MLVERMRDIIETALSTVSSQELKDRISKFESSSSEFEYEDTLELLKSVILFETDRIKVSAIKSETREYKEGSIFFRVRKLKREILNLKHSDFWEAPKEVIERGRINRPMEQLLYMSPNEPYTPIRETHIGQDDPFLLIAYKTTCPLSVFSLGVGERFDGEYTHETERKLNIISDFIKRNFLKKGDAPYVLSNVIAQEIYRHDYDGWVYPSVANEGRENLCLKLTAKESLEIQSAYLCELVDEKIKFTHAIQVNDDILIYNDWKDNDSSAYKILDSLMSFNKVGGSEIETRDDVGYSVNILTS